MTHSNVRFQVDPASAPLSRVGFCHATASKAEGTPPDDEVAEGGFFSFLDFLRGGRVVGQGSGKKCPIGNRRPSSTATKMRRSPWAKQLCSRGRERLVAVRPATGN